MSGIGTKRKSEEVGAAGTPLIPPLVLDNPSACCHTSFLFFPRAANHAASYLCPQFADAVIDLSNFLSGDAKEMSDKSTDIPESEANSTDIPIIDLSSFLSGDAKDREADCKMVSKCLHELGLLIIKDPRVSYQDNDTFIDMMEEYYSQPFDVKAKDIRKEFHYQVGTTPNGIEKARDHCSKFADMGDADKPATECPPGVDPKWRFFWRMGEQPPKTEFTRLNADPVIPEAFKERWPKVMDTWGGLIVSTIHTIAEMAAIGFDLPADTFTNLMKYGPHLLAPTGSDLKENGALNTVFAKYHYDLNFITIHGKSRYPGLFVWTREGKKVMVKVPQGSLLIQAGKQFEYLTGGEVLAGYHEVMVAEKTIAAIKKAEEAKKCLWRVSSTLFAHVASDNVLVPQGKFATKEALEKYPPIKAGDQVQAELNAIKLG